MISLGEVVLALVLIGASAFFSMAETSLTALGKFKVRCMVEEGRKGARYIERATEDTDRLLSTVLIGSNFANIALGSLVTAFVIAVAGSSVSGVMAATAIATVAVLIFGEMTPKTIAMQRTERVAALVARPLSIVMTVFSPVAAVLNFIIQQTLTPFGFGKERKASITENELKTMLEVSYEEGVIEQDEHKMLGKVMEFDEVLAKDVMTPRTDMVVVDVESTYNEVLEIFSKAGLSRLPVFQDNIDNITGVLHIKDFISAREGAFSVKAYMREPFFTLELKHTRELFTEMRRANTSQAIILDEYGGTAGLLSMEDLIEEIVGEIFDEHDSINKELEHVNEHEYLVNGAMKIDDFNEMANIHLDSEDYESVGGYVMGLAGVIPKAGMSLSDGKISFKVEEMERNRIERLRIKFMQD